MNALQAPKAPSDHLRREAARILPRLALIIEFRSFLDLVTHTTRAPSPLALLWETCALGAPLCTLLNLLGSPPPRDLHDVRIDPDKPDLGLGLPHREWFFSAFIQRTQLLEVQGRIPYGEVLRVQDLFGGTNAGFAKVLKTVERVLNAVQDSYPGLFVLPSDAAARRAAHVRELLDSERAHIAALRMTGDSAELLAEGMRPVDPCIECLIVSRAALGAYHARVLRLLEDAAGVPRSEDWGEIFAFESAARRHAVGAYRSICANYLGLADVLQEYLDDSKVFPYSSDAAVSDAIMQPLLYSHAQILLSNVSLLLTRASAYASSLEKILAVTSPADCATYDALCAAALAARDTAANLDEMGRLVRTLAAARIFKGRAFAWRADVDPAELGALVLDDVLAVAVDGDGDGDGDGAGLVAHAVFLFETMLLCCLEDAQAQEGDADADAEPYEYPVRAWELGPALQRATPLNLVHAIPTARLRLLRLSDSDSFELEWADEHGAAHALEFGAACGAQCDQWRAALEVFAPSVLRRAPVDERALLSGANTPSFLACWHPCSRRAEDEDAGGRRRAHARPWSVVARKGPRSESSSLLADREREQELLFSPNLLPRLFGGGGGGGGGSHDVSPLSINTTFPRGLPESAGGFEGGFEAPLTPPVEVAPCESPPLRACVRACLDVEADPNVLLDLTGEVRKEGSYPQAHGGFADVWKGVWDQQADRWVAIKVLRSRLDDARVENKMKKRLARELSVWKRLEHKHVLRLLGTVAGFGPYASMVCPWLEQGSVSKYMERRGDILSMTDRLQLLCEVAEGLHYLHENSIVHGDLTGSNILIDDEGKVKLCDFGLSTIVAEICGTASLTSTIGGAVRWADAALYVYTPGDTSAGTDAEAAPPALTTRSDIYSFGSVMLEILSGRIPYHYVKTDAQVVIEVHKGNKPRRPAASFVMDAQWALIQRCWAADPAARPGAAEAVRDVVALHRASLEVRRHTY
ncbi:TKL/TKL-ccin protein kinase [Mycena pura]|uniref:TKL/TKL-ccin protein kinase n=1 Tax=Mycena pura TaxID=153505 RepID=A0AAD6UPB8_9AGAR|nr:TKL/TKL-ccin protein kinase [Mycena pura]